MIKAELIHGSCADQSVDAVVNAANRQLAAGGGICGVIFNRAGYAELTEACNKHKRPLKDGEAAITPSFGLKNAKAIIHAVGPNFAITPDAIDELTLAYYNSLVVLKDNGYHSISFPLISSGIFGEGLKDPAGTSAKKCREAVRNFVATYPDYDVEIKLCAFTKSEYEAVYQAYNGDKEFDVVISTTDPITQMVGDKVNEDGSKLRVVEDCGQRFIVRI